MKKAGLCLALCAAISVASVVSADAASKKSSGKSSKAKATTSVTVRKAAPPMVANFNSCVSAGAQVIPPLGGAVSAVGCGVVWAVPVMLEAFLGRRA